MAFSEDYQRLVLDELKTYAGICKPVKSSILARILIHRLPIKSLHPNPDAEFCDLPLCVLVNGMSASASEILAAAVQDFGRGTVVGTQTYGKGIVQSLLTFEADDAGLQYTSERYFTPSGKCIHGVGVTPDVVVDAAADMPSDSGIPDPANDLQLREAMRILKENKSGRSVGE